MKLFIKLSILLGVALACSACDSITSPVETTNEESVSELTPSQAYEEGCRYTYEYIADSLATLRATRDTLLTTEVIGDELLSAVDSMILVDYKIRSTVDTTDYIKAGTEGDRRTFTEAEFEIVSDVTTEQGFVVKLDGATLPTSVMCDGLYQHLFDVDLITWVANENRMVMAVIPNGCYFEKVEVSNGTM